MRACVRACVREGDGEGEGEGDAVRGTDNGVRARGEMMNGKGKGDQLTVKHRKEGGMRMME